MRPHVSAEWRGADGMDWGGLDVKAWRMRRAGSFPVALASSMLLCVLLSASPALARSRPRLVVEAPGTVFVASSVHVAGQAVTVPRSGRVVLLVRELGRRWRRVARG